MLGAGRLCSGRDREGRDHVHGHLEELKSGAEPRFSPYTDYNFIRDFLHTLSPHYPSLKTSTVDSVS